MRHSPCISFCVQAAEEAGGGQKEGPGAAARQHVWIDAQLHSSLLG